MLAGAYEDAAGLIGLGGFHTGGDQAHDLILQLLAVAADVFVEDHQIHLQPFQSPVVVRLDQLLHQLDVLTVGDGQQHDRQIAGDRMSPQP
ncbi:hypothetical protein D3C81_949880 [compost metagenome]